MQTHWRSTRQNHGGPKVWMTSQIDPVSIRSHLLLLQICNEFKLLHPQSREPGEASPAQQNQCRCCFRSSAIEILGATNFRNDWGVFKEVIRGQDLQGAVWGLFSFLLILLITKYFFLMIYEALKGILRNQKHRVLSPWRAEPCTWTSVLRSQEGESRGPLEN